VITLLQKSWGILGGWLACLIAGLGLPGCAFGGPQMTPGVQFAMEAVDEAAPAGAAPARAVRVHGWATVPTSLKDLANVQDGKVSGSPVLVKDAASGRTLAKGVTYYDGSFMVDVPLMNSQRAAIVAIDLVDRADATRTATLQAPVLLKSGVDQAEVALTPGSTALVEFLAQVATVEAGETGPKPRLGDLISTFEPAEQKQFAKLAEASPEMRQVSSLTGFATGIRQYVGRLTGKLQETRKSANGATQVASR
jgi:hypothetical protein